jgi:hypothetical protein
METGNIANLKNAAGQLVVEVLQIRLSDEGERDFLPFDAEGHCYTAAFQGWYRNHHVGCAATEAAALRDLAAQSGVVPDWLTDNCEIHRA